MIWKAKWIKSSKDFGDVCPSFFVDFSCEKQVKRVILRITATGVYEAVINKKRVGEFILAPGWTAYEKRLQVQEYDVTQLIATDNQMVITVGKGWYRSSMPRHISPKRRVWLDEAVAGLTAELVLTYDDCSAQTISTDESWKVVESQIRFSEIYDGEIYDATYEPEKVYPVTIFDGPTETLIPQQGAEVREQERISVAKVFMTPNGDKVFDFGQEVTGYVEITVEAEAGEQVRLSFAEVMDKEGNFYTENYRGAKSNYIYICKDGKQTYKPKMTFYGFRYIRIDDFPGGIENAKPENFNAIVVHSQMERTGYLRSSNSLLNKLFDNIIWGQKGNFLDVPTDCPQRDERLGWTGDVQVFIRTACLNFDVEKFFTKWLGDVSAEQKEDGMVGHVIPNILNTKKPSAAWDDVATICPWQLYLAYGNAEILAAQYDCMEKWIGYITNNTTTQYLWTGGTHYEDWLALDSPQGSYKGSTRADFIASAFYAYSTELLIKAGKVLGKDMVAYETLYAKIVEAFRQTYAEYNTQTECVLAVHFKLAQNPQKVADQLANMVRAVGTKLQTGFVGTPYLLHVLSDYGYTGLAYDLLLRTEYPSWLYQVTKGATTVWEHWDGIMENGDFWSADMNSFNHYAYGAVADWVYCLAAGIQTIEEYPGYEKIIIAPLPDDRLDWLDASVKTRRGLVRSRWQKQEGKWRYEIDTPVETTVLISGKEYQVNKGSYLFYSEI